MKSFACEVLLVLSVAACSSSGEGEPATDASAAADGPNAPDAPPAIDAPPSARNAKAVGDWDVTSGVTDCGGFAEGLVGTALANDNQFQLVFNEALPNGTRFQTTCTFTSDTAFACTNVNMTANLGGCIVWGGISNMNGMITGTAFSISGSASSAASAQCPGGARSCGPSVSTGEGTIVP